MTEAQIMSMLEGGQEQEARALLEAHLKKRPADALANKLMAMIYGAHEQDDKALFYIQRAAFAAPKDGAIRFMLGNVLLGLKRHKEAAAAYRECTKIAPGDVASHDGLGKCMISLGRYDEAKKSFEAAISANPDNAVAYGNYANALILIAKLKEAVDVALRGLARLPEDPAILELVAYAANFPHAMDNNLIRSLHERLGAQYAKERAHVPPPLLRNTLDPERTLRVGFVSSDYSLHACAMFMKSALLHFDRARIVPYCYCTALKSDGGETPFKAACEWRDVTGTTLDQFQSAVLGDKIDILVDCNGLTEGQRLRGFIPRIAPVQCTWLGYPNTTGLPAMDYRLVDGHTDPPENEGHCTEKLVRIPGCFLCFTPDADAPEPSLTPATMSAQSTTPVMFGSFNRMTKVTDATVDAWCAVLRAVPNSHMLLKLRIASEELRRDTVALFTSRGIEAERIEMVPFTTHSSEHAKMYGEMDIALDCFPYNGTTTTCEATWMGVPVVVLAGDSHRSRVGVSLNTAMGLGDLIAASLDEYVAIAARLASDRAALGRLKLSLRERMKRSMLCDAAGYARRFEDVLRDLWHRHCYSGFSQPPPSTA